MSGLDFLWRRKPKAGQSAGDYEAQLNLRQLPEHIAVIMDGNGRWATLRGLPRTAGHRAGMTALKELVNTCGEIGIKVLTVYAFSTENWKRPSDEVSFLMNLLVEYMDKELNELHEKGVLVRAVGEVTELPASAQKALLQAEKVTEHNKGLRLNIALNYGGRREIICAVRQLAQEVAEESLNQRKLMRRCSAGSFILRIYQIGFGHSPFRRTASE